ncbi:MAG: hypothetical protein COU63_00290 [Candidatus Pacebacteria bacterium CG10_big_fil_rev_8_21_14_0_10_36_11]|nr:MAG: hypothetical protein AUK08_03040 [Candidatus Pacebacteria bacterium CG2_30_36_39]PIR65098.1 MAG: hypothetical protein COU63_00290 [Candidatus Pacebacteria bacterium CG10_big_fil_rev_8_21_14_0_10_36_11]PJC42402.1 MAG: hypothetical protein CO040_04540 [Candidatus Pacebacteria bacterium CG_4_9_14_0_2_um_filter_36_8]
MSKRHSSGRQATTGLPNPQNSPAQQYKFSSDELDNLVDSFIDLIIDDFIVKYRSGQLDVSVLKKKGVSMFEK